MVYYFEIQSDDKEGLEEFKDWLENHNKFIKNKIKLEATPIINTGVFAIGE